MKTKRVKARIVGTNPLGDTLTSWLLPRTPEAYDAMVESMAREILHPSVLDGHAKANYLDAELCNQARDKAKRALRAIGITRPQREA